MSSLSRTLIPALLIALAGCAVTADPQEGTPVTRASDALLGSQHWRLADAHSADGRRIDALFPDARRPLTLDFANGRLRVSGGCNGASAPYRLDDSGQLALGELASTMKACAEPLMQADRALHALLSGNPVRLTVQPGEPPALVLESPDGSRSSWTGEPTAETRYGTAGELVFLEVAPVKVDCNHPLVPGHQCLQVREVHYDDAGLRQPGTGEWQPLYARIEGFEFVEGERKILRVRHFVDGAAPADAPVVAYVLDMVVESERVAPAD